EGAESWLSLSFMTTRESISGGPFIPRPTDQRMNFNLFFQDNLRSNENLRAHLNLVFGTGLPFGSPEGLRNLETLQYRGNFRLPAYRRVDLGMSYHISAFRLGRLWLSAEIFNLFNMNNTISYLWISDFNNTQYAVANHLTSRRLNFRISMNF
ncbi:MAG: TonB-dependent receptor, partial [Bacteroidales bacterium]|nr:TonB-dependent receptor [Bacteroidales bacterium]